MSLIQEAFLNWLSILKIEQLDKTLCTKNIHVSYI